MQEKKFVVLVIYDIVDNKVRSKMVKCLETYGVRVQKSAFEALLNRKQYQRMIAEARPLIDDAIDSLRVYVLNDVVDIYTWGIGDRKEDECVIL